MEFIRVNFDARDIRDVLANGNVVGRTETELSVPPNFYVITLSGEGFTPLSWLGIVTGTMPAEPLIIRFNKTR
jgi:hypothetical protein